MKVIKNPFIKKIIDVISRLLFVILLPITVVVVGFVHMFIFPISLIFTFVYWLLNGHISNKHKDKYKWYSFDDFIKHMFTKSVDLISNVFFNRLFIKISE